jgi:CheY-like chemotaxis protein
MAPAVVLISEKLLLEGIVPRDLLEAGRFDLRSVQQLSEITILAQALSAQAVILDLRVEIGAAVDPHAVVRELRPANGRALACPIVGVLDGEFPIDRHKLFEAGVNALLTLPLTIASLQTELEAVLGLQFRKFERKEVDCPVTLAHGQETWNVTAKTVNLECLAVEGDKLPPLGINVFMTTAAASAPIQPELWCFCWRKSGERGLLVRFLDPSAAFIDQIERLPATAAAATGAFTMTDTVPAPAVVPATPYPADPRALQTVPLAALIDPLVGWFKGSGVPAAWEALIRGIPPGEKDAFLQAAAAKKPLAEYWALKFVLDAQVEGLRSAPNIAGDDLKTVIAAHDQAVKRANADLQKQIIESLGKEGKSAALNLLNELKSALQKSLVSMQKTQSLREQLAAPAAVPAKPPSSTANAAAPAPARSLEQRAVVGKRPEQRAREQRTERRKDLAQKVATLAVILLLPAAAAAFIYSRWTAPQRAMSRLSAADVTSYSRFFSTVEKYEGKGQKNFTVLLTAQWSSLSEDEKKEELRIVGEKFKLSGINYAEMRTKEGFRAATYSGGQVRLFAAPSPPKPR